MVIPPAFGLIGLDKAIFTGDGDTAHEPAGPVSYWNRYVGVTQMHGHGTFFDERLIINGKPLNVDHRVGDDLITPILPQLEAYQWSIPAPSLAQDGAKWGVVSDLNTDAVGRGKAVFEGQGRCATCHSGKSFTDVNTFGLHPASDSVALDKNYIKFSATKQWRTTPLKGIWEHPPYFHDGSGALNAKTGKCMDGSDIGSLAGATDRVGRIGLRGESVQRSGAAQPWVDRRPTRRSCGIPEVALIGTAQGDGGRPLALVTERVDRHWNRRMEDETGAACRPGHHLHGSGQRSASTARDRPSWRFGLFRLTASHRIECHGRVRVGTSGAHLGGDPDRFHDLFRCGAVPRRGPGMAADAVGTLRDVCDSHRDELFRFRRQRSFRKYRLPEGVKGLRGRGREALPHLRRLWGRRADRRPCRLTSPGLAGKQRVERRVERRQTGIEIGAEVQAQQAALALRQDLEVAARLRGLDDAE